MQRVLAALVLSLFSVWAGGCGIPSFLVTPVPNANVMEEHLVSEGQGWSPPKIAVIEVEGTLLNAKMGGLLQATENDVSRFTQQMELAARDPEVKAVVLRVNSPGGTVTASDIMYQTVMSFRERTHKPVVAALQDIAASGAYYVSCAADRVVAHPTSVVGSIGVIFQAFSFEGTLEKIGASSVAIKSGPLKDMGSPWRALDPQSKAVMQGMVDEYYQRFVAIVGKHRKITDNERLKQVTDGRVFTGARAAELGLVDRVGLLTDAIEEAKSMAGAPQAAVVMYRRPYGYGGSIYARESTPEPRASVLQLSVPGLREALPVGFYYLWMP